MCKGGATIVLQRAKQRIGINLIARTVQISVTVVTADVIAERVNRPEVADDTVSAGAHIENGVAHKQG
jgi:hypothetical protein